MSKGILDTLNIKSLEEILAETESEEEIEATDLAPIEPSANPLMDREIKHNSEHAQKMDDVYSEALEIARKVADMGMNIDPMKAPRMFEVAGQHLKIAIDASDSKIEAGIKLMKLIQDQKKLELDEMKIRNELGEKDVIKGDVVMIEDRNKLIELLRSQKS